MTDKTCHPTEAVNHDRTPVEMCAIPKKIWDAVYKKWDEVKSNGWQFDVWQHCDLCRYMFKLYGINACEICPLSKDGWCNSRPIYSRLNIKYHFYDEKEWSDDISSFLNYISPYCSWYRAGQVNELNMEDIPQTIYNDIYEKWRQAYLDGWSYLNLWQGCSLCRWMRDNGYNCDRCVLKKGNWCTNFGSTSKLSIYYNNKYGDKETWKTRLEEFLVFLKPYCGDNDE